MPPYFTVQQAADHIGVSAKTIRRRVDDGTLAAMRVGPKLLRIDPRALDRFMTAVSR